MTIKEFVTSNKNMIIEAIHAHLSNYTQNNQNYETVWKEYQTQVCDVLINILCENGFVNFKRTQKKVFILSLQFLKQIQKVHLM